MGWSRPDLTAGRRPALRDAEEFIVAQPRVALYDREGRDPAFEGWAYLTSQRMCVVANGHRGLAAAVELTSIEATSYTARFLKNSAKIAIESSPQAAATKKSRGVTWICRICSYPNELSASYMPGRSELPICETCGVRCIIEDLEAAERATPVPQVSETGENECPKCTFMNHPEMDRCEMCGTLLKSIPATSEPTLFGRTVRLSFRAGGSHLFGEKLGEATAQAIAQANVPNQTQAASKNVVAGLHSLMLGQEPRQRPQVTAGEDIDPALEVLLDLVPLKKLLPVQQSPKLIAPITVCRSSPGAEAEQTSRQLLEFVVDGGALDRAGGTLALHDLFAEFSRARVIGLLTPQQLHDALVLWDTPALDPPEVEVRTVGSAGLRAIVRKRRLAVRTQIRDWMARLEPWQAAVGVGARQASDRFGWSIAVAAEELILAEKAGELCRDDNPRGVRFFPNLIVAAE